jgi:hypothetical protein
MVLGGLGGVAEVWCPEEGILLRQMRPPLLDPAYSITALASYRTHEGRARLAVGMERGGVCVYDLESAEHLRRFDASSIPGAVWNVLPYEGCVGEDEFRPRVAVGTFGSKVVVSRAEP